MEEQFIGYYRGRPVYGGDKEKGLFNLASWLWEEERAQREFKRRTSFVNKNI